MSLFIMGKSMINRRIGGSKVCLFLLYAIIAVALVSCANDIHPKLSMDFPKADNITFTVIQGEDTLKITDVILSEISKRGYNANIKNDTGIVNGIMSKYSIYRANPAFLQRLFRPNSSSDRKTESSGTGFFVNNNGTIVTCAHVISGAKKLVVDVSGTHYDATVISINESTDLAIIKIDYASKDYFSISEFELESVGNKINVLGYPLSNILGKEVRLTDGLISAKTGINSNPTYFQMSAPIQPGNSGGPIFNEKFQVIGIASSKLSDIEMLRQTGTLPQNVNFGVKSEYVKLLGSQHFDNKKVISSMNDAINATVQVIADPELLKSSDAQASDSNIEDDGNNKNPIDNIEVVITYLFNKDAMHYTSTYLKIEFIDASTGNVVGSGTHIGDSYGTVKKIATVVLKEMLDKIK